MARLLALSANLWSTLRLPFPGFFISAAEKYLWSHPKEIKFFLSAIRPEVLWKLAEQKLIIVFNRFLTSTPALKSIRDKFFPDKPINSLEAFREYFPVLDKNTYLHAYTLEKLCQNGVLPRSGTFYKSAGTSGKPTLWIESVKEELEFDAAVAFIGHTLLDVEHKEYVILNCWAFGLWPTGMNFFASARFQGKMVNIGTDIQETLGILKYLGPNHNYLLSGYPPFIFRLIQDARAEGIRLADYRMHVVTGGEGFVEEWRDELIRLFGKESVIFSVYGSTDKGLCEGVESNFAYALRSLMYIAAEFLRDETAAKKAMELRFGPDAVPFTKETAREFLLAFVKEERNMGRIPMIFQFNPLMFYNENHTRIDPEQKREVNEFVTTTLSLVTAIPRVRYNVHDEGRVINYEDVRMILDRFHIRIADYNPRNDPSIDLRLPFLILYGRSDGTISVDGANIFPEDIEECLRLDYGIFSLLNSFQLFVTSDYRLGLSLELTTGENAGDEFNKNVAAFLRKELPKFSLGYREIQDDNLPSADIAVETYRFGQGPFKDRNLKLRYVRH